MTQQRKAPDEFAIGLAAHMDTLYAVGRRLTRSESNAEDLVQDTLVKALRAREQFIPGTNLKAWLLRIQMNTFINRYRRGGLERDLMENPANPGLENQWTGSETLRAVLDPEGQAVAPMLEQEINVALERLPEDYRTVVLLCDLEGLAYREIAEIIGCPIGTVMSRLHRGRKLLQADLIHQARAMGIVNTPAAPVMGKEAPTQPGMQPGTVHSLDAQRLKRAGGIQ